MTTESINPTPGRPATDAPVATAAAPSGRIKLVEQYRRHVLRKPDPLSANLAMVNCGLVLLAGGVAESVNRWLSRSEATPESFAQFERRVNLQLRVTRQIQTFARLDRQQED